MKTTWQATDDGYFFSRNENLSAAVASKLEGLVLEDSAQILEDGTLIPFEKSFVLSEEDAELLDLPPLNPYRISIRTEGYIGGKNFKYVTELLNSKGRPFVKPQINGALIRIGTEIFRLDADQFALINLVEIGNKNLQPQLITIKRMQNQAAKVNAQLDGYLSSNNKKIIVADKLSVDFVEMANDKVKVQPILLGKNDKGDLAEIESADFQGAFNNRRTILDTYRGKNAQYIFSETLRDGLAQIKSVGMLSKADAARYKLQPKELFTGEAFDFNYSDRVIGTEEIPIGTYQIQSGIKLNWTDESFHSEIPKSDDCFERPTITALKIKENFEQIDYEKALTTRYGKFLADVLNPGVKLLPHQIFGVWYMSQLWQKGWQGVLIADDMGLGKTLQTLTFIAGLKKFCAGYEKLNRPMLIVAPTALLTNWQDEYEKFLRGKIFSEVISLHGNKLEKFFTNEMENFSAIKTPATNDYGADVVVQSLKNNAGFLIQCKHRKRPDDSIGNKAVQEICAAVAYYEKKYLGRKFQPVVITNAKNFTSCAIELAQKNGVRLMARQELENMFVGCNVE